MKAPRKDKKQPQRRKPERQKNPGHRDFSAGLGCEGQRTQEGRVQGIERSGEYKRRNSRVCREGINLSAAGEAQQRGKKKKKKDPTKANTKGRNSLWRRHGWRRGRDEVSQRDLGLRTGG